MSEKIIVQSKLNIGQLVNINDVDAIEHNCFVFFTWTDIVDGKIISN